MEQKKLEELKDIQERVKKLKTNNPRCPKLNPEKQIDAFAIALDLVSSVMLGLIVGFTLDKLFHSKPFCIIIFLLIGMLAGFRIIWQKLNIRNNVP
ncbi:MAG: AtpZ/AtpI family protein [Rickettsia endosymbiont of Culicoides impunctatus]|uniref:AtpZ/AtpI family protein n=1 Tax=unclassified Candidatus Tisiphia TaxID=2996318 RepID=UPI001E76C1FA|nr:MAG: AtpZ/AtpI family protein [Rickettsia endosymbiont of Culicoides impunctatus]